MDKKYNLIIKICCYLHGSNYKYNSHLNTSMDRLSTIIYIYYSIYLLFTIKKSWFNQLYHGSARFYQQDKSSMLCCLFYVDPLTIFAKSYAKEYIK